MQDNRRKFSDNEKQVLFDEVHGRCPICGRRLTHSKNGHFYRTFEVAHIYPANPKTEEEKLLATEERLSDDVNSLKNVVAVCRISHKKFDTPRTIDEYRTWVRMKKKLLQENEIKDNYALFNIEVLQIKVNRFCRKSPKKYSADSRVKMRTANRTPSKIGGSQMA